MDYRGTIVIDSTEMDGLGVIHDLKDKRAPGYAPLTARPTRTYFDMLIALSEQGWKIIIPEMVALETGNMLTGGASKHNLFMQKTPLYPTMPQVTAFLSDVCEGKYPNIEVQEPPRKDKEPYAMCLREMHRIFDDKHQDPATRRRRIIEQQSLYVGGHLGEKHAIEIIRRIAGFQQAHEVPEPIIFLCSDIAARRELRACLDFNFPGANVGNANIEGLLDAIARSKTTVGGESYNGLEMLCMQPDPRQHWDVIQRLCNSDAHRHPYLSRGSQMFDAPLHPEETDGCPLRDALGSFAENLAAHRANPPQQEAALEEYSAHIPAHRAPRRRGGYHR